MQPKTAMKLQSQTFAKNQDNSSEGLMKKISKISIYNLLKENATTAFYLDPQVTILTGHNGVGKSTLLASIHSSISVMNRGEYIFPRSDWASQIKLSENFSFNHFKLTSLAKKNPDLNFSVLLNKYTDFASVGRVFDELHKKDLTKSKDNLILSTEGEKRDSRAKNISFFERNTLGDDLTDETPTLKSILYCDELFNFNINQERSEILEDLDIFSKKNTLDKTLYLLLNELSSTSSENKELKDLSEILVKINKMFKEKKLLDSTTKSHIDSFVELQSKLNHSRHSDFFTEANIFFNMTGREIFLNDKNLLSLKIKNKPNKTVEWFNLSKGEKTLLCLLLVAYLNNSDDNIFLLDEPDLSLHIQWQKQLIKSLVTLAPNSQFIISTHSPALIGHIKNETIINIGSLIKG